MRKKLILLISSLILLGVVLLGYPALSGTCPYSRVTMYGARRQHYSQLRSDIYRDYLSAKRYKEMRFYVAAALHDLSALQWDSCRVYKKQQGEDCNSPVTKDIRRIALAFSEGERNFQAIKNLYESVVNHIEYEEEEGNVPQFPYETLIRRAGDCEDQAILLATLLNLAGFESGLVRLCDSTHDLHHVFCIVKVDPKRTPCPHWSFENYAEQGYCWKILDPAYTHDFYQNPDWTKHYRTSEGRYAIPGEVSTPIVINWDEYKKLCAMADGVDVHERKCPCSR